jgi:hypothetical protein
MFSRGRGRGIKSSEECSRTRGFEWGAKLYRAKGFSWRGEVLRQKEAGLQRVKVQV